VTYSLCTFCPATPAPRTARRKSDGIIIPVCEHCYAHIRRRKDEALEVTGPKCGLPEYPGIARDTW